MPNQYHDAQGRFCSRNQMQAAINKAAQDNDPTTYLALRKDFEAASKSSNHSTPDLVVKEKTSTNYTPDEATITAIQAYRDQDYTPINNYLRNGGENTILPNGMTCSKAANLIQNAIQQGSTPHENVYRLEMGRINPATLHQGDYINFDGITSSTKSWGMTEHKAWEAAEDDDVVIYDIRNTHGLPIENIGHFNQANQYQDQNLEQEVLLANHSYKVTEVERIWSEQPPSTEGYNLDDPDDYEEYQEDLKSYQKQATSIWCVTLTEA